MFRTLTAAMLLMFMSSSFANNETQVHGAWKLVSYEVEVQETGETFHPMGQNPTGYVVFTPEQRVWFVLTGEGRKPANTIEGKAALLDTIIAYTGNYRIEDNMWITSVEVAWNPQWVDTEQAREFKVDGDRLQVFTPWRVMPNWPEKVMTSSIVTFERYE